MIKCKLATDSSCENCKEICSFVENRQITDGKVCDNAIVEGNEIVAFESNALSIIQSIADIASKKKELEDQDKKMREQLEAAMELYNVKSFENDLVKITYVEPTTRTSVDSAKLKKKYPDVYTECSKVSEVKGSVRITVK